MLYFFGDLINCLILVEVFFLQRFVYILSKSRLLLKIDIFNNSYLNFFKGIVLNKIVIFISKSLNILEFSFIYCVSCKQKFIEIFSLQLQHLTSLIFIDIYYLKDVDIVFREYFNDFIFNKL